MGIGHNNGPTMEPGTAWRRHCWSAARTALLPHLPIEILRGRLKRAAELGLEYKTYAGIRATTGRDVVAVLFSSNALEVHQASPVPSPRVMRKLPQVQAQRLGLATPPIPPAAMLACAPLHAAFPAPPAFATFAAQRDRLRVALQKTPSDQTVLIGSYSAEAEWCAAARLAGYIPAEVFFSGGAKLP